MTQNEKNLFTGLNQFILKEKQIIREMKKNPRSSKIISLKKQLAQISDSILEILAQINLSKKLDVKKPVVSEKTLQGKQQQVSKEFQAHQKSSEKSFDTEFYRQTLKRLRKKEAVVKKKKFKKPSAYTKLSNRVFSNTSLRFSNKKFFKNLKKDLVKANLHILPASYISVIFFTTFLSVILAIFIFIFLLIFNIGIDWPIITLVTENIFSRFLKVFWVLLAIPLVTFLFMYFYPSMERKATASRIDQELPFVAIHLSAIAGSMVEPSKIFKIIIATKEYPFTQKEFVKLINKIHVYGYNIVGALRDSANNSASKKLSELFNGMATTITSGGDLNEFFEKRSQTLLFDYRLSRERYTRSAETFMDIYISVVIAAPMIFMLLLIIIKVGGLGISISTSMITLLMVLGVSLINVIFLVFLHLKQPSD